MKGGGAAHTREKIVAAAADAIRRDRVVRQGGGADRPPIPLELLAFGLAATLPRARQAELRDCPPSPDGGVIADYRDRWTIPPSSRRLAATPGVVEHGLFPPGLVSDVIVGAQRRAA